MVLSYNLIKGECCTPRFWSCNSASCKIYRLYVTLVRGLTLTLKWQNRLTRLVNQSAITCIIYIRQIRRFLAPASTNKLLYKVWSRSSLGCTSCASFQIATSSEFCSATYHSHTQIVTHCHITPVLLVLHYGYRWISEFAIKSLWSILRLFTIWGLRI